MCCKKSETRLWFKSDMLYQNAEEIIDAYQGHFYVDV